MVKDVVTTKDTYYLLRIHDNSVQNEWKFLPKIPTTGMNVRGKT